MPNIWNIHSGFKEKKLNDSYKEIKIDIEITFGSFNNFDKLSDKVILVWSKILKNIKNSKLILRSSNNINKEYTYSRFKEFSVNENCYYWQRNIGFDFSLLIIKRTCSPYL